MKTKRIWALAGAFAVVMLVVGALILPASGATGLRQEGCFPLHEVQPDETLDSVAELYGISVPDLLAANELADDTELYAGQQLCIPTSATEVIEVLIPQPQTAMCHPGLFLISRIGCVPFAWFAA